MGQPEMRGKEEYQFEKEPACCTSHVPCGSTWSFAVARAAVKIARKRIAEQNCQWLSNKRNTTSSVDILLASYNYLVHLSLQARKYDLG